MHVMQRKGGQWESRRNEREVRRNSVWKRLDFVNALAGVGEQEIMVCGKWSTEEVWRFGGRLISKTCGVGMPSSPALDKRTIGDQVGAVIVHV